VSSILIEILNLERAVRPPGNIDAAIPDVAVAMAINPLDRTLARRPYIEMSCPCLLDHPKKKLGFCWRRKGQWLFSPRN